MGSVMGLEKRIESRQRRTFFLTFSTPVSASSCFAVGRAESQQCQFSEKRERRRKGGKEEAREKEDVPARFSKY